MVLDDRTFDEEFEAYATDLKSRSHFTFLTKQERESYEKMCIAPKVFTMDKAAQHPFLWAYHVIGIKPRDYQWKILNDMMLNRRTAVVTSRQIGKSTCAAIFAFWAAYKNMMPSGPQKNTKVLIVSHTEQASKNLLRTIDDLIHMADARMAQFSKGGPTFKAKYFHDSIVKQTVDEIEFHGGRILAYPPTEKVRGLSIDVLMIDEAAWLNTPDPEGFFNQAALPTTTNTLGKIVLFSTPRTTNGFFHDIIRPNNDNATEGWTRLWMPWIIVDIPSKRESIWQIRKQYIERGDELSFKIEYEGDFHSGKFSYFAPDVIDRCVHPASLVEQAWPRPLTLGLDFGDTHSRTVMFAVEHDLVDDKIKCVWFNEFPEGFNNADLPAYLDRITGSGRFMFKQIICDDCVGGKTAIELLRRRGYNLKMFGFKADKEEYYEYLKVAFARGKIDLFKDSTVINQLKQIEAIPLPSGRTAIRKPYGGRDDICDAMMMACSPFIKPGRDRRWRFENVKEPQRGPKVVIRQ